MASWPSLPAPLINTFKESVPDNILRTQMDRGINKVRRRTTANARGIQFTMLLSKAQVATLETFYVTTTSSGADEFTCTHPRTAATVNARFTQPPSYSDVNGINFRVEIAMEILP
jgi:hypothetical protein